MYIKITLPETTHLTQRNKARSRHIWLGWYDEMMNKCFVWIIVHKLYKPLCINIICIEVKLNLSFLQTNYSISFSTVLYFDIGFIDMFQYNCSLGFYTRLISYSHGIQFPYTTNSCPLLYEKQPPQSVVSKYSLTSLNYLSRICNFIGIVNNAFLLNCFRPKNGIK